LSKIILYGVLNWGLGHATRSVPLIRQLQLMQHKVIVASDGDALSLLKKELKDVEFETLPSYNAHYAKDEKKFNLTVARQVPHILKTIGKEQKKAAELAKKHQAKLILSDNRYGFFHPKITSVFIGHQLHLNFPQNRLVETFANFLHRKRIEKFNHVWIPDNPPPNNLSGILSLKNWKNTAYIGALSRMESKNLPTQYDACIILSGPEPQRTILEEILLKECEKTELAIAFVRGILDEKILPVDFKNPRSKMFNFCTTEELNQLIEESKMVVCRSGYSSVMDLVKLQKKAVLIPTPGLPEQNYLAEYLKNNGWFYSHSQQRFHLEQALAVGQIYEPPKTEYDLQNFEKLINSI
jgi:uncharacterized protein (TIGR00661 family)